MKPQRAVILAAGLGTRLKWLTRERPKALMHVAGEPAIAHVIRRLAAAGIGDIAVNLHHHAGLLSRALGDGSRWGVRLYFSHEPALLDSGGGVRRAMTLLPGSGPLLVHNADILADVDLDGLGKLDAGVDCSLVMVPNPPEHPDGDFALVGGRVIAQGMPRYTFGGISLWRAEALLEYPSDAPWSLVAAMRDAMAREACAGILHRGLWFDIGKPRALIQARLALAGR